MSDADNALGILIVGHGSPRPQANEGFIGLVGRIAARLGGQVPILPTFFSIARPSLQEQVALLAGQGVRRIVLMPYFLYRGQHVFKDIPSLLEECKRNHPQVAIEFLPTLENEPGLEDIVVDRLAPFVADAEPLPTNGQAIAQRSFQIIDRHLPQDRFPDKRVLAIVRRVVHATADVSFGRSMRIHSQAIQRGLEALAAGKPIICDVRMVQAGITAVRNPVLCAIGDEDVRTLAQIHGCTRAAAAMEKLADSLEGAIVAIGNAPTALWKLMEIARGGGPRPALVAGLPVGFVGAAEAKLALIQSDLCYISNTGPRGGSPVVAAAINALASLAKEREVSCV